MNGALVLSLARFRDRFGRKHRRGPKWRLSVMRTATREVVWIGAGNDPAALRRRALLDFPEGLPPLPAPAKGARGLE